MIRNVITNIKKTSRINFRQSIIIETSSCFRNINLSFRVLKKQEINFKDNKDNFLIIFTIEIH